MQSQKTTRLWLKSWGLLENISQLGVQISHDDHSKAVVQRLCSLCPSNHVHFSEPIWPIYSSCLPPRHLILFINSPSPLTQWRQFSICTVPSHATEKFTDQPAFGLGDMAGPVQHASALQWRIETANLMVFCNANFFFFFFWGLELIFMRLGNERSLVSSSWTHAEYEKRIGLTSCPETFMSNGRWPPTDRFLEYNS